MSLFTVLKAAAACGGSLFGPDINIDHRWCCDSREVVANGAFAAIRGAVTDGHLYIRQAIEHGAKVILAESNGAADLALLSTEYPDVAFIAAEDTEKALTAIAKAYLRCVNPRIVAITGSVGKTTTRELTAAALKKHLKVHSAIKSFNTLIGTSLTILSMAEDTKVLVLEFGTNHFGEIAEMVKNFPPQIAVITEVAPCHLAGFGTVEGVLKAKTEICASSRLESIVYNYDNTLLRDYMSHNIDNIKKVSVGKHDGADIKVEKCFVHLNEKGPSTTVCYSIGGKEVSLTSSLFGIQHAYNMGYAFAISSLFGMNVSEIADGISELSPISGRGVCKRCARNCWVIDEAYNANPASLHAAIENTYAVADTMGLKKEAILGGMRELGEKSDEWHRKMVAELSGFDNVKLLGDEWHCCEPLPKGVKLYSSLDEIIASLSYGENESKIVLIKGSNSYGLKRVVEKFLGTQQ